MEKNSPSKQHDNGFSLEKILKSLLIIIIGVAVVGSAVTYYNIQGETRRVIRDLKNINLAIQYLAIEEYGTVNYIRDNTRKCGLSKWAEQEIKNLAKIDGDVYLTYQNPNNSKESEIMYLKDRYIAKMVSQGEDKLVFTVYRNTKFLTE